MPVSDYHQISSVLEVVEALNPGSILDIGCGFGKWGVLCREILEVYHGKYESSRWEKKVDGIEIFEPYKNLLWDYAYNRVYQGNAIKLLDGLEPYDLILCCDVIEHFEKPEGLILLQKMLKRSKAVVLTSPHGYYAQGPLFGNPNEEHKSGWQRKDFLNIPHRYKDLGFTFMVVMASDPKIIAPLSLSNPLGVLGVKKGLLELARLLLGRLRHYLGKIVGK